MEQLDSYSDHISSLFAPSENKLIHQITPLICPEKGRDEPQWPQEEARLIISPPVLS